MTLTFEWDEIKAEENLRKHGISFEEAKTVFNDPLSITIYDPDYSTDEDRYLDVGLSSAGRMLVVCYTERGANIRLISSRTASKKERQSYEREK